MTDPKGAFAFASSGAFGRALGAVEGATALGALHAPTIRVTMPLKAGQIRCARTKLPIHMRLSALKPLAWAGQVPLRRTCPAVDPKTIMKQPAGPTKKILFGRNQIKSVLLALTDPDLHGIHLVDYRASC